MTKSFLLQNLVEVLKDPQEIEHCLQEFFRMLRVGKEQDLPKRNTAEMYKSCIKSHIMKETSWDITNIGIFPKFNGFYRGYLKTLIEEGKAEKKKWDKIPPDHLDKILQLLSILHGLILGDPNDESYTGLLEHIPFHYQERIHLLAQYGMKY